MTPEFTLLTDDERRLVTTNLGSDPVQLALKLHGKKGIDGQKIIQQIVARQKARAKLPDWYSSDKLFFPPPVSVEQASSQATARYKASLVAGEHLADLTTGMGVDAFYFSKRFNKVTGYETDPRLASITAYNMTVLGALNVRIVNKSGENPEQKPDCIFIDPSRRDARKRKVAAFEDSSPNILELLPRLADLAPEIMIKSSPLVDIDLAVSQLRWVSEVHVTGYQKECKELVFILKPHLPRHQPEINAVVIDEEGAPVRKLAFTRQEEAACAPVYGDPAGYLYEPHPAFMKAGAFNLIARKYGLIKIAANSHLYASEALNADFPGRIFSVKGIADAARFSPKDWLQEAKANLTLRNFPSNPDDLRKKWRLKDGGHDYLFPTTLASNKKVVIITERIDSGLFHQTKSQL